MAERNESAGRRPDVRRALRVAGRYVLAVAAAWVVILVGAQFYHVIERNFQLVYQLSGTRKEVAQLQTQHAHQLQDIKRLSTDEGAVPEIHDRLRLVRAHEAIIYLKPAPSPVPSP